MAKILYGMPDTSNDKLMQDKLEGKVVFGGCGITGNDPDYVCAECGASIYSKTGKFTLYEEDDF